MGTFIDNDGTKKTRTGNLLTKTGGGDEDWYVFDAVDIADTTRDNFSVRVQFTNVGGYVFDAYRTGLERKRTRGNQGLHMSTQTSSVRWTSRQPVVAL